MRLYSSFCTRRHNSLLHLLYRPANTPLSPRHRLHMKMNHQSVLLTKDYIRNAFLPLEETQDIDKRNIFFTKYMIENVTWEVAGNGHSMAGTRYSVADHTAATFARMRIKITAPIRFVIRSIILDAETRSASVELTGYATKLNGKLFDGQLHAAYQLGQPYDNEYVWLTTWNDEGKIESIRSYHDTHLAEMVLNEEF